MPNWLFEILLVVSLLVTSYFLAKPAFLAYLRKKKYQEIINTIQTLYQDCDPYQLSKSARANSDEDLAFTYGEIDSVALLDLLNLAKVTPNDTFYDLGSGAGKALIATKLCYPFLNVKGIELLEPLASLSEQKWRDYLQQQQLSAEQFPISMRCEDFLKTDFSDGSIFYIHATAMSPVVWEQLLAKLLLLKPGTRVIMSSKQLPSPAFIQLYSGMEKMSWGLCSTYIYERSHHSSQRRI